MIKLTQVILGANSLIQSIIPSTLFDTPKSFYDETNNQLQLHAYYLHDRLSKINGLQPIRPGGTMYLMVTLFFVLIFYYFFIFYCFFIILFFIIFIIFFYYIQKVFILFLFSFILLIFIYLFIIFLFYFLKF